MIYDCSNPSDAATYDPKSIVQRLVGAKPWTQQQQPRRVPKPPPIVAAEQARARTSGTTCRNGRRPPGKSAADVKGHGNEWRRPRAKKAKRGTVHRGHVHFQPGPAKRKPAPKKQGSAISRVREKEHAIALARQPVSAGAGAANLPAMCVLCHKRIWKLNGGKKRTRSTAADRCRCPGSSSSGSSSSSASSSSSSSSSSASSSSSR